MDSALDQISVVAIGYAVIVALAGLYAALGQAARPSWLDSMSWFLEVLLLVRAVAGVGAILSGHRPDELSATVGYLVASVTVMPIALGQMAEDRGKWSCGVIAVSALALAVISLRLVMTT